MSYDSPAMEPPGGALVQERYARGLDIVVLRSTAAHWALLTALTALYILGGKLGLLFAFVPTLLLLGLATLLFSKQLTGFQLALSILIGVPILFGLLTWLRFDGK